MVQLKLPHRPEQRQLLAACTTSLPKPPAAPVRPEPGIAAEVLFDLRAEDVTRFDFAAARALLAVPMHDPAEAPQSLAALLARAESVMLSRHREQRALFDEAMRRRSDIAAATWVDGAIGDEMTETAQAVLDAAAARPELMAPPAHPGPRLWLRRAAALLTQPLPVTDWTAQLADAFAPEVSAR